MAAVGSTTRSAASLATSRVVDAEIDAVCAGGESRFPYMTAFIPSDLVTDKRIREHHAEGSAVVIVDEHGNERFLPVPQ